MIDFNAVRESRPELPPLPQLSARRRTSRLRPKLRKRLKGDGKSSGRVSRSDQDAPSAAELFDLLWESLADVLGTAATATLLRRAIKRAASHTAWSEPVVVTRNGLEHEYRLPETWKQPGNDEALGALRVVAAELRGLLVELTGPVVVRRLGRLLPFRKGGIDFSDEEPT